MGAQAGEEAGAAQAPVGWDSCCCDRNPTQRSLNRNKPRCVLSNYRDGQASQQGASLPFSTWCPLPFPRVSMSLQAQVHMGLGVLRALGSAQIQKLWGGAGGWV